MSVDLSTGSIDQEWNLKKSLKYLKTLKYLLQRCVQHSAEIPGGATVLLFRIVATQKGGRDRTLSGVN